jgi:predicted O-methyltransferase YrrM
MNLTVKGIARRLLSESTIGAIDYYRRPDRRMAWGGPFNGQAGRRAIFDAIVSTVAPALILETGTYLGTTTELMAETGIAIVSVEGNARNFGFARRRLRRFRNVELRLGDSRIEARRALDLHRSALEAGPLFAYLDAHWNENLPLVEELDIVFGRCPTAAVMVDDFSVPGDPGYGYDDYGPGKTFNQSYIAATVDTYRLAPLYPVLPSAEETGQRRGCVVLAREIDRTQPLLATGLLRRA